ncbi:MAG: hypothetical protein Kow0069_37030 [Promethearchaeota archaeon]
MSKRVVPQAAAFGVFSSGGRLRGVEKPHVVYSGHPEVRVQEITSNVEGSVTAGLEAAGAREVVRGGDHAAIKVNLGGGIDGVPSSYTDPELVRAVVAAFRKMGARSFVCEADMRGRKADQRLLRNRGYLEKIRAHAISLRKVKLCRGAFSVSSTRT